MFALLITIIAVVLLSLYACFFLLHRCVLRTGQPVKIHYRRTPTVTEGKRHSACAQRDVVEFCYLAGDMGTALVAREILDDRVYFKHGITLSQYGSPLVVDIGANIGLFALAVAREFPNAVVVGAEPVPKLYALAVDNTRDVPSSGRIFFENMGVGREHSDNVPFVVNPLITAGTSMCEADIVTPFLSSGIYACVRAVLLDNVRAGNFPRVPCECLARGLAVPYLRVGALAVLIPALILAALYVAAGPLRKQTFYVTVGTFQELLGRAAVHCQQDNAELAARIRGSAANGGSQPCVDLVKIDVEGAEMDVVLGISASQWRRIRQVVVETHDVEGRAEAIVTLLRERGFSDIIVDADDWASHELLRIKSIYARKAE